MFNQFIFAFLLLASLLSRPKFLYLNWGFHYGLIFIAGLVTLFYHREQIQQLASKYRNLLYWILLFYFWIWLSALNSDFPATAIKHGLKYSIYLIAFGIFLLIPDLTQNKFYSRAVFRFIVFISGWGIIEYLSPNLGILDAIRYPNKYPRISAIVQGPNQLGVLMAMGAVLAIILYRRKLIAKPEVYLTLITFMSLNALSASRNGWLVFIIGLALLWLYKLIQFRGFVILMAVWSFLLLFFPVSAERIVTPGNSTFPLLYNVFTPAQVQSKSVLSTVQKVEKPEIAATSDEARAVLWKEAIQEFYQKPFTGIGVGVFAEHIGWKHSERKGFHTHNLFLSILVELGIPGLLLFIGLSSQVLQKAVLIQSQVSIPLGLIFASQQFDFFINDYTFTILCTYFIAIAVQTQFHANPAFYRVSEIKNYNWLKILNLLAVISKSESRYPKK